MAAAVTGFGLLARKVGAQPLPLPGMTAAHPPLVAPRPPASAALPASAAPEPAAAASGSASPRTPLEEDPVDYAEAPGGQGVPVHQGHFRSPFAHPRLNAQNHGPIQVRVGLLLSNVRDYDIQKGSFDADFYLTYTSDRPMPAVDPIFSNGKVESKEVMADKPTFKMFRFLGSFTSPPDLHDYPFDSQELTLEIEDDDNGTDQMVLVPDPTHTHLDVGFQVPGWETASTRARVVVHNFPDRFDHDDLYYARYEFSLGLKRYSTSAIFTVFFPAITIVLISLTGLFLPRHELEVRANATVPMLAAAVLFHYSLTQALPATAYLTRADKLMMVVYIILGLHMLLTLLWFFFPEHQHDRLFRLGKYVGAPLTLVLLAAGIFA